MLLATELPPTNMDDLPYQNTQPVLQPQVNTALLDGLLDDQQQAPPSPQIDTSFLDDLL